MLRHLASSVTVLVTAFALFGCTSPKGTEPAPATGDAIAPPVAAPAIAGASDAAAPAVPAAPAPVPVPAAAVAPPVAVEPMPGFVEKGIEWIVRAQHPNGGWGAGSHAHQDVRDPKAVTTDPATTAFTALALIRAGHTPRSGEHRDAVRLATEHLCGIVEEAKEEGARITELRGTQPQAKLGDLVDTSMTVHFFARVVRALPQEDPLRKRVDVALEKCLRKLQGSQATDGSWGQGGGWAPVLQSSLSCSALEMAKAAGKQVDGAKLDKARDYLKDQFDAGSGRAATTPAAAGVELYAFAGSQRAAAQEADEARTVIENAKREGKLGADAPVSAENIAQGGYSLSRAARLADSYQKAEAQLGRLDDEKLLTGFGNNGGEEYLSYLLSSESLVVRGGEAWEKWNSKMRERLSKIQSPDGSWTGHHCITSPVFCTAAVVQCLTADREADLLRETSKASLAAAKS